MNPAYCVSDTISFAANAIDDVVSVENFEAIGGPTKIIASGQLGGGDHMDGLSGQLDLKNVPSDLLLRHVNHRFKLDADVDAKVSIRGTAMDPEMKCDLDIKEGILNDKIVKDLHGSFLYKYVPDHWSMLYGALSAGFAFTSNQSAQLGVQTVRTVYRDARAQANLSAQVSDPHGSRKRRRGGDRGEKFTFDASIPFRVSPLPTLHSIRNKGASTTLVKVVEPSAEVRLDMKVRGTGHCISVQT